LKDRFFDGLFTMSGTAGLSSIIYVDPGRDTEISLGEIRVECM